MNRLDQLFEQFLRERTYINHVTPSTREWYECAWEAFTVAKRCTSATNVIASHNQGVIALQTAPARADL